METRVRIISLIIIATLFQLNVGLSQNDLPNPNPDIKWIHPGSLVIGTDNVTQSDNRGRYNLKVYGLINAFLQASIPVKWAIKSGKVKDGIDFTALAQQISPVTLAAQNYDFKSGPFIIESTHYDTAMVVINQFANGVKVYKLTNGASADIRYTVAFKPNIAVLSNGGNQNIHLDYLHQAGIINITGNDSTGTRQFLEPWVSVIPANQIIDWGGCYTFASEAHWDTSNDTIHTYAIYRFLQNGSNFLAQCEGVQTYENDDTLATNIGIDVANASFTYSFYNPDMPFLQIDGGLDNIGGSLRNWVVGNNGSYKPTSYLQVGSSDQVFQVARTTKVISNSQAGGNAFYLGGHDYGGGSQIDKVNGRRMYLNTIFVPAAPLGNCLQLSFPLPVTLLNFQGSYNDKKVGLEWTTGSEINNDHFIIERSADAEDFQAIGKVAGSGNSNAIKNYFFIDHQPVSGLSYYRLIQVDFDGKQNPSKVIAVIVKEHKFKTSIYPNPVTNGKAILEIVGPDLDLTSISILNSMGEIVMDFPDLIKQTENKLVFHIDLEFLSSGYYTVRIRDSKENQYTRFIKTQ